MPASITGDELERLHEQRVLWLEEIEGPVVALPTEYPDGHLVPRHSHSRSQLLYALAGVVLVTTDAGRWMVPPEHAIWLPAGVHHAVEILGAVSMRSIYIAPDATIGLPTHLHVVALTDLMRCLIVEAVISDDNPPPGSRGALVTGLLLDELHNLPERPLGLPFPAEPRLSALCRRFVEKPSPHATIDEWAAVLAMSRRSFTRSFQRETGLSFSVWRQQACLFAALPRLADGEPVTSVALDLGYESVPAFTTMFKRMLGVSPRFYLSGTLAQRQQPS
ncbi:AraC family transcriptional regulator [Phyllobacterium phragmitis]|uniref:AraC family transcriptional regulator n=2 Tax=Phyllobacterium phragmitis TaxID=2670329 RepID=A0A2S9IZ92_9HYPH|nr:helix-turn-helix transcriptional regulator [Phyllobacterium phragmitis]PRD45847.1 AraC family transcriptional regulator [Phyllobacterium phragmitis]